LRFTSLYEYSSHHAPALDGSPVQAPGYDNEYNRRPQRPQRRERDDKVHESIIEERIQRERPCRTLFIRNIKASCVHLSGCLRLTWVQYETPSEDVRALFEEHGEIKTFFDLISTRGMVFVTYVCDSSSHRNSLLTNGRSLTSVQQREPEKGFRVQKSAAVL